jgi:hypothetical protein
LPTLLLMLRGVRERVRQREGEREGEREDAYVVVLSISQQGGNAAAHASRDTAPPQRGGAEASSRGAGLFRLKALVRL